MKVRLFDILDLNRPLAKAARDFDWTEVVGLFPEAHQEGMSAAKIWILASLVVLGELTGLSEGEVLARWPENPYWQAFSGLEQFQWQIPVSQADCIAFRRFVNPKRAARLSLITNSLRNAKPIEGDVTAPVPQDPGTSGDETLALRQIHFSQPLPAAPYKAPPRPDFQSSIKHTYAKSAAAPQPAQPAEDPTEPSSSPGSAPHSGAPASPKETAKKPADPKGGEAAATAPPSAQNTPTKTDSLAPQESLAQQTQEPLSVQTYAQMFKRKGFVPAEISKSKSKSNAFGAPVSETKPVQESGSPQFDTTAPLVLRVPPGEPIRMEVSVSGDLPLRYQWEQWDDIKGVSTPIEGCIESSLTVALEPEDGMLAFQCRVFNRAAPQGLISRTFFIKKGSASQKVANSFGEKFDPKMFGLKS